jgi:hypothetical protein
MKAFLEEVEMTSFLALYRGDTITAAQIVAVSADPHLVSDFAARLLGEPSEPSEDPVVVNIEEGRRKALEVVKNEGK